MNPPGKYQLKDSSKFRDLDPRSDEVDVEVGFSMFEELSAVSEVEEVVDEVVEGGVEDWVEVVCDMKRRGS